jgi:Uma2 family endonuclease
MATTTEEIKAPKSQAETSESAPLVRRFSREEFAAVADALPDDRLELMNGEIIMVPPPDKTHMKHTARLIELFAPHYQEIAALGCQIIGSSGYYAVPKELRQQWVTEGTEGPDEVCPDASICYRDYLDTDRRPPALLVVEVLSLSKREQIDRDLVAKAEIYAALEIPAYWVVDRRDGSVWVHTKPGEGKYRLREQCKSDRALAAPGLEFLAITAAQIFEP